MRAAVGGHQREVLTALVERMVGVDLVWPPIRQVLAPRRNTRRSYPDTGRVTVSNSSSGGSDCAAGVPRCPSLPGRLWFLCPGDQLGATAEVKFPEDSLDMGLGGPYADNQRFCNLLIAKATLQ